MSGWGVGDILFILLICALICGLLRLANRRKTRDAGKKSPAAEAEVDDLALRSILAESRTVAMVGASSSPTSASHHVMEYLQQAGYTVVPVNPGEENILGARAYSSLSDIPEPPDIVDVFRKPEHVPEIARQAVARKAKVLWLQEGVGIPQGARIAREAGLTVVMDRCMLKEHRRLLGTADP